MELIEKPTAAVTGDEVLEVIDRHGALVGQVRLAVES